MTTIAPQHQARHKQYVALVNQGLEPEEIAARLRVKPRAARTYLRRHDLLERSPIITDEQRAWAERAMEEGVPISWVAETVGLNPTTLGKRWRDTHGKGTREFGKVWPSILHSPTLYALHEQFAPKKR